MVPPGYVILRCVPREGGCGATSTRSVGSPRGRTCQKCKKPMNVYQRFGVRDVYRKAQAERKALAERVAAGEVLETPPPDPDFERCGRCGGLVRVGREGDHVGACEAELMRFDPSRRVG